MNCKLNAKAKNESQHILMKCTIKVKHIGHISYTLGP